MPWLHRLTMWVGLLMPHFYGKQSGAQGTRGTMNKRVWWRYVLASSGTECLIKHDERFWGWQNYARLPKCTGLRIISLVLQVLWLLVDGYALDLESELVAGWMVNRYSTSTRRDLCSPVMILPVVCKWSLTVTSMSTRTKKPNKIHCQSVCQNFPCFVTTSKWNGRCYWRTTTQYWKARWYES